MSKRINAKYKISRRLGASLWGHDKDPFNKRPTPPGQHGATKRRKLSDFGKQLFEKQKLKGYYGNISEKQFLRIYKEAVRRRGDTGENLIALLESRLDAFVYRSGMVPTVFAARQLVNHGHLLVNGKRVNIPSYRLQEGDEVSVRDGSKQHPVILESLQNPTRDLPDYITFDSTAQKGKFMRNPKLMDVPYPVMMEPNFVIEFYSR